MIREIEFQLLCRRHRDEIYRYARGLLGNQMDAEDATQEALLRLWNHLHTLNPFGSRAWLYRTTRNYCLDQLRRRSTARTDPIEDDVSENYPDAAAVDPGLAADSSLRLEQAERLLLKLPESLRSVFVLYEVNGLRYREIAEVLCLPINTVKTHLLRAREKLSKLIPKEESWTTSCKA